MTKANYVGGRWVSPVGANPNINPSDVTDVIGEYAVGTALDVENAISAARAALPKWQILSPQERADMLETVGIKLLARRDEIGRMLSREEGKTLKEAVGETVRAGQIFKFFAQEALRVTGDIIASVRPGIDVEVTREPVGVVALITPWNFPIAIPAWKIAPALAFGNTVIFKPAELTPACAHILTEIIVQAGFPAGVFNLVMGSGAEVGQAIVEHPGVDAVSFTGSVPVGRRIAATAVAEMKRVQLEMGGNNPMVILDDADLDMAIAACVNGAFFSTGQRCTASSRLIVQSKIYDAFVDRLSSAMRALRVGDALDPKTEIGPVVSSEQLASNLEYVRLAAEEGAEVVGGERQSLSKKGYYQAPALFLNAKSEMRVVNEEIFGPCAAVIRFDELEEGISIANDTEFGLASGICTASLSSAREFKRRSQAGMVMINLPTAGVDYHVPFGGRKLSSYGPREQGRYAAEFYSTTKTSYVN